MFSACSGWKPGRCCMSSWFVYVHRLTYHRDCSSCNGRKCRLSRCCPPEYVKRRGGGALGGKDQVGVSRSRFAWSSPSPSRLSFTAVLSGVTYSVSRQKSHMCVTSMTYSLIVTRFRIVSWSLPTKFVSQCCNTCMTSYGPSHQEPYFHTYISVDP